MTPLALDWVIAAYRRSSQASHQALADKLEQKRIENYGAPVKERA